MATGRTAGFGRQAKLRPRSRGKKSLRSAGCPRHLQTQLRILGQCRLHRLQGRVLRIRPESFGFRFRSHTDNRGGMQVLHRDLGVVWPADLDQGPEVTAGPAFQPVGEHKAVALCWPIRVLGGYYQGRDIGRAVRSGYDPCVVGDHDVHSSAQATLARSRRRVRYSSCSVFMRYPREDQAFGIAPPGLGAPDPSGASPLPLSLSSWCVAQGCSSFRTGQNLQRSRPQSSFAQTCSPRAQASIRFLDFRQNLQ